MNATEADKAAKLHAKPVSRSVTGACAAVVEAALLVFRVLALPCWAGLPGWGR